MRVRRSLFTFFATIFVAFGLVAPAANAAPVVNQGDRIFMDVGFSRNGCTVGYVDHAKRQFITSGHCVNFPGQPVFNERRERIGTVMTPPMDLFPGQNDYAYIALRGAHPGANGFSGNGRVHPSHIRPGERICTFGASTRQQFCGTVYAVRGSAIFFQDAVGTRSGDSGGPTWIPGRGFVGALSGGSSSGKSIASAPYFYFGPDLLWQFASDIRQPVTVANLLGSFYWT
mgnify:CR=1 FL=1